MTLGGNSNNHSTENGIRIYDKEQGRNWWLGSSTGTTAQKALWVVRYILVRLDTTHL